MVSMEEKIIRAVTRPHKLQTGKYKAFSHSVYVRSVAFAVSMETQISDFHALCGHLYGELRDPQVRASITQSAIRDGVSAANAHRTATKNAAGSKPPSEPEFDKPVVKLNSQGWKLNGIAGGYIVKANIGSRESPLRIIINVPRSVAKRIEKYELSELWITPDTYTITYSKKKCQRFRVLGQIWAN